jgi:hypothetical protein
MPGQSYWRHSGSTDSSSVSDSADTGDEELQAEAQVIATHMAECLCSSCTLNQRAPDSSALTNRVHKPLSFCCLNGVAPAPVEARIACPLTRQTALQ